ncbi:beta galactosidase jelly roll domain-containing protein [Massilia horti]|uniref:Beta-galactosidase n=1 Tax=Massilia horti TaxID=2562153 RepID=A0A4Y9T1I2_9BURK|nr:beta galactosidase jelly roll domain-containing protein [Massilia horti]TFW30857.1 hypothetical protein E4O92_15440 [Massilia horti]
MTPPISPTSGKTLRGFAQAAIGLLLPASTRWAGAAGAPLSEIALTDNRRFTVAQGSSSWAGPAFDDANWDAVSLPHTWDNFVGHDGGRNDHRGNGWYRTHFQLPATLADRRVLLEFDAASKVAEVFVNGTGGLPARTARISKGAARAPGIY